MKLIHSETYNLLDIIGLILRSILRDNNAVLDWTKI